MNYYSIGKYEVTQELYEFVMKKNPFPDKENKYGYEIQRLRPVSGINWYEAAIFCNELSKLCGYQEVYTISDIKYSNKGKPTQYVSSATVTWDINKNGFRLPTEAEWEYAARGAGRSLESWKAKFSGSDISKQVAWTSMNSSGYSDDDETLRTHEVGLKKPNEAGIYDMSGNVFEWCMDWYRSVTENGDMSHGNAVNDTGATTDPILPKGNYNNHVIRGGSYKSTMGEASNNQRQGKVAALSVFYADMNVTDIGIRLVRRE